MIGNRAMVVARIEYNDDGKKPVCYQIEIEESNDWYVLQPLFRQLGYELIGEVWGNLSGVKVITKEDLIKEQSIKIGLTHNCCCCYKES